MAPAAKPSVTSKAFASLNAKATLAAEADTLPENTPAAIPAASKSSDDAVSQEPSSSVGTLCQPCMPAGTASMIAEYAECCTCGLKHLAADMTVVAKDLNGVEGALQRLQ